jgi:hypothetical protein
MGHASCRQGQGRPGHRTVSKNLWVASGRMPLDAVKVRWVEPECLGLPLRTPVAALKLSPEGNVPETLMEGCGDPDALTVNEP